jgi:hypothetical protein
LFASLVDRRAVARAALPRKTKEKWFGDDAVQRG